MEDLNSKKSGRTTHQNTYQILEPPDRTKRTNKPRLNDSMEYLERNVWAMLSKKTRIQKVQQEVSKFLDYYHTK